MSSTAEATSAPATSWCARRGETPGSPAISSGSISSSLGIQSLEVDAGQDAAHEQCPRSTAPPRRCGPATGTSWTSRRRGRGARRAAACRRRGRSGCGSSARSSCSVVVVGPATRRSARGSAGPPRAAATTRRRAPRRRRPRSPATLRRCRRRPAGPRTSRTSVVRRGRSAGPRPRPGSTRISTPGLLAHPAQHVVAVVGVAHRGGGEASRSPRSPCPRPARARRPTNSASASTPAASTRAVLVEVLGQPQRLLERGRRHRRGTPVGVHDEQVPGVGTDVEHAEAHGRA